MGIDVNAYRCKIGLFLPHHSAGVLKLAFHINFSVLAKMIGAVSFIRIMLLIAGIEQNPGPTDLFIFRYQYLLIEVGTKVLRQIFDKRVGKDINNYLNTNPYQDKQLKFMVNKGIINDDQKKVLPPIDKTPTSANFDITLLSCLLRNICGLSKPTDVVWKTPVPPGDLSLEADITRLRDCRNNLFHIENVLIHSTDLNIIWNELDLILHRLNRNAGVTDLASLISSTQDIAIDEKLKKDFDDLVKSWSEMDKLFDHKIGEVMMEMANVKQVAEQIQDKLTGFEENQTKAMDEVKSKTETKLMEMTSVKRELGELTCQTAQIQAKVARLTADLSLCGTRMQNGPLADELLYIQEVLMNFYKQHYKTLPVLPLFGKSIENLLLVYESPVMHTVDEKKYAKEIICFEDILCKEDKSCNEIYITGDAGVGKTSFCRHLCFLWCNAKCGQMVDKKYEYVSKFDCVFYINLRDTEHYHVVDMIKECYLEHYDPINIQNILRKSNCLILLDGLDEWNPKKVGIKTHELPKRMYSDRCIYLTTTRPYRIERLRLSKTDVDNQVHISGIQGKSLNSYIEKIVNYMNELSSAERKSSDFQSDIKKCGLTNEIVIPIIASQLVVLWYEKTLDGMTRPLIYANILEMLFQRAEQRKVMFPPHTASTLQLPGSLSGLIYLNEYVSLLYKVCHLSFCSMFKQDENSSNLVFSRHQLQSEPFCLYNEEIDFLCKIGILSTNEVFGFYPVEKLRISFIHKSYLEFLAALFISSFDSSNLFRDVTKTWKCLNDVVQFGNIFLLLAGFSLDSVKTLFENIYLALSDDLTSCRKNALFHYNNTSYIYQLKSLQNIVVNCFKEVSRSNDKTVEFRMEDFLFDEYSKNVDILRKLLLLNATNVKSLHCDKREYFDEFDQIKYLQCIKIVRVSSADYVKFTHCMLQNKSTLHTVCIDDGILSTDEPLIPDLLVRSLHHLTSLSLSNVKIQHNSLHYLVKFLSDNVLIENIKLSHVSCVNHQYDDDSDCSDDDSDCTLTLNLQQHTKLTSLYLQHVNILCNNVNNSSLQSVTLCTFSERIVRLCYNNDLFNCLNYSQLEHLYINGSYGYMFDYRTMKTLTSTVKSLPCLKSLRLRCMELPDDVILQLHPQVTQVEIELCGVTMSRQCFHCFVESCVNNSEIKVELVFCQITSVDGETHSVLSREESVKYMSKHLESISTINITRKDDTWLDFETRSCQ